MDTSRIVLIGILVTFSYHSVHSDENPAPVISIKKKDDIRKPASIRPSQESLGTKVDNRQNVVQEPILKNVTRPTDGRQDATAGRMLNKIPRQKDGGYLDKTVGYQATPDDKQIEEKSADKQSVDDEVEGRTDSIKEEKELFMPKPAVQRPLEPITAH